MKSMKTAKVRKHLKIGCISVATFSLLGSVLPGNDIDGSQK